MSSLLPRLFGTRHAGSPSRDLAVAEYASAVVLSPYYYTLEQSVFLAISNG